MSKSLFHTFFIKVRNYGPKKHREHQIVVSGVKRASPSVLYIYADSLEVINIWYAALRIVLKVPERLYNDCILLDISPPWRHRANIRTLGKFVAI